MDFIITNIEVAIIIIGTLAISYGHYKTFNTLSFDMKRFLMLHLFNNNGNLLDRYVSSLPKEVKKIFKKNKTKYYTWLPEEDRLAIKICFLLDKEFNTAISSKDIKKYNDMLRFLSTKGYKNLSELSEEDLTVFKLRFY